MNRTAIRANFPPWGLGGAGLGNLYRAIGDDVAIETVHAALENGVCLIDTAPRYGHGRSELRIGAALKQWRGALPLLSSKVGRVLEQTTGDPGFHGFVDPLPFTQRFDYSRAGVRRSLEGTLERLGVARLTIALVHDIGRAEHGADYPAQLRLVLDETLPELEAARSQGLLDWIGLGLNEPAPALEILERAPLDCVLLAGRYTLLEQSALTMLDICAARGVTVLAAGVFNSGLLATPPSPASSYDYARVPPAILKHAESLWQTCAEAGVDPQAAALQFPALHPAVASVIVGAQSAAEIAQIARWREQEIPATLWDKLKREGFIDMAAPIGATTH